MAYDRLLDESPHQACAAILGFCDPDRGDTQLTLLSKDLAQKAAKLGPGRRRVVGSGLLDRLEGDGKSLQTIRSIAADPGSGDAVDVVVVTVFGLERDAALCVFDIDPDDRTKSETHAGHSGRRYYRTTVRASRTATDLDVIVTSINRPWNSVAAAAVTQIFNQYPAQAYFLVGIAGGLSTRVHLGDVVIPESVYYYPPRRSLPDFSGKRPGHPEAARTLWTNMGYYNPRRTKYYERLGDLMEKADDHLQPKAIERSYHPTYHHENIVIASGEDLILDGRLADLAANTDQRIAACDQEAFGFAEALYGEQWVVVRGISDYASPDPPKDCQHFAATAAALIVRDFLESQYEPPGEIRMVR